MPTSAKHSCGGPRARPADGPSYLTATPGSPPRVFVILGAGGAGKGTLVSRLVADVPGLWLSRSWTTRPRRRGEPGDAYVFVDEDTFRRRRDAGGFLEWASFLGHLYGTPKLEAPPGCDVVLEIDVQGARQVVDRCPEAVVILIVPPDRASQECRLRARGDDDAHVAMRLAVAEEEERRARELAHHVIVNDDVERASAELAGIVAWHRQGP